MEKTIKIFIILLLFSIFIYLPVIANQKLFLDRGNDLAEFFTPIIYFTKREILINHSIPLWNIMFFSGTPLLPDPQSMIFYLPNFTFLFVPLNLSFVISMILHTFLGSLGMYSTSKKILKFNNLTSLLVAILYISSPRLMGYLEAGHFGLILAYGWLPWVVYGSLSSNPLILAITLAGVYFTHLPTFIVAVATAVLLSLKNLYSIKKTFLAGILCFGLTAMVLLPQIEWLPHTTRSLLLKDLDVYPKWESKLEFLKAIVLLNKDTEKIITLGTGTLFLSFIGFTRSKRRYKFEILTSITILVLISLNNASPIYKLLLNQNWFVLMRVATRFWVITILIVVFLSGFGLEIIKKHNKALSYILITLAISESLINGYQILSKPIMENQYLAPEPIYEYLSKDKDVFRIFCLTRCLSQNKSAFYGLNLAEGYGTLQQKNYYDAAKQIAQAYWDRYSLSIPPFEIYLYQKLKPHPPTLAIYGIKYVISPYPLIDKDLSQTNKFNNFHIYLNKQYKPPKYIFNSPNHIKINTLNITNSEVTIPEIYNNGWQASSDKGDELKVSETKSHTISVTIKDHTKFIDLTYMPKSFKIGTSIMIVTILLIGFIIIRNPWSKKTKAN